MPFKVYLVLSLDRLQPEPHPTTPEGLGAKWEAPHPAVLSENPPLSQFFVSGCPPQGTKLAEHTYPL